MYPAGNFNVNDSTRSDKREHSDRDLPPILVRLPITTDQ